MLIGELITAVQGSLTQFGQVFTGITTNAIVAIIVLLLGVFIGKFFKYLLRHLLIITRVQRIFKEELTNLLLISVKWIIYITFLNFALVSLKIPVVSSFFSTILNLIPGLVLALILIVIGYTLGFYLKTKITEVRKEWAMLGNLVFIFTLYIVIVLAITSAFVLRGLGEITGHIILIITAVGSVGLLLERYYTVKGLKKK